MRHPLTDPQRMRALFQYPDISKGAPLGHPFRGLLEWARVGHPPWCSHPHIRSHIWGAVSAIWMVPRSEVFDCTEHTLRLIVLGETAGPDPPMLHIVLPPQPHAASTRRHALGCVSVLYGG